MTLILWNPEPSTVFIGIEKLVVLDVYVYAISKSYELNKNSIKIALFCEELLNKKPIIYSNIVKIIVDIIDIKINFLVLL